MVEYRKCYSGLHVMTPENTWIRKADGAKYCKECRRRSQKDYRNKTALSSEEQRLYDLPINAAKREMDRAETDLTMAQNRFYETSEAYAKLLRQAEAEQNKLKGEQSGNRIQF